MLYCRPTAQDRPQDRDQEAKNRAVHWCARPSHDVRPRPLTHAFPDGLDMSAIREVKFLQELHHPNIIALLDVFSNKTNLNLVLEYLDTDLEALIKDKKLVFQAQDVKSWMAMMFKGVEFCHRNWVLHRVSRRASE